jgi:hypothetical protein
MQRELDCPVIYDLFLENVLYDIFAISFGYILWGKQIIFSDNDFLFEPRSKIDDNTKLDGSFA